MPRGRPRKIDPKDALKTAMHTLWERGYERTSMADLVSATGMAKPGLYANLGDKDEIFQKALRLYQEEIGAALVNHLVNSPEPLKQSLRTALRGVLHAKEGSGLPEGCFIVNNSFACSAQSQQLKQALKDLNFERRDAFLLRLRRAETEGELPDSTDINALADFFAGQAAAISSMAQAGLSLTELDKMIEVSLSVLPEDPPRGGAQG